MPQDNTISRGLTLGKYAPLHRGHQHVFETALQEVSELVVLIYEATDSTDVPLTVRADWIRSLYPQCTVIEITDGPTEVGYTSAIKRAHEQCILRALEGQAISHFYSSELYGEHVSQALGAVNRTVDRTRSVVPISARVINQDVHKHRALLPPIVYRSLITNVVFVGAPSTGKSTLAEHMASIYRTQWMPEHGREYWENNQVERRLTLEQLNELAHQHIENEDALLFDAKRYLFTDTNALTTAVFSHYYHNQIHPQLAKLLQRVRKRYDVVFLCGDDIPYDDTEDRSGDDNRRLLQNATVNQLNALGIRFHTLLGDVEQRTDTVRGVLAGYNKWANQTEQLQS